MAVSLTDLGLAYRKAKVDLYYSTQPSLFAIAKYEDNLERNLRDLLANINSEDDGWVKQAAFLGGWTLAPKGITPRAPEGLGSDSASAPIYASPAAQWEHWLENGYKIQAEFRLMAKCSLDFHVLSSLWIMTVGAKFDAKLSRNVYGSRLRRTRTKKFNKRAMGSFTPYLKPFRDWRDGAIDTMRTALQENKNVVALTADVNSFYHGLTPDFLKDERYLTLLDVELTEQQSKLNRLFVTALKAWASNSPLKKGLPVGLPASAVVANLALWELDRQIEQELAPLYYGRYVDDILLVIENSTRINTTVGVWQHLFERVNQPVRLLRWEDENIKDSVLFAPRYLRQSRVNFSNSKNKVFILSGSSGMALVDAIAEQIHARASEWRALPDLPSSPSTVATELLKATNNAGEHADNLRKTDALTLHRASFALKLRDYEAYERDLPPAAWQRHRHAFLDAVIEHLITPVKYFELFQYLPRIIRMATACEDFSRLSKLLAALDSVVEVVGGDCELSIKSEAKKTRSATIVDCWKKQIYSSFLESVVAACPHPLSKAGIESWDEHMPRVWIDLTAEAVNFAKFPGLNVRSRNALKRNHVWLFGYDLAHVPLRFLGLPKEMIARRGMPKRSQLPRCEANPLLPGSITKGINLLAAWCGFKQGVPQGLYFSTRPFGLAELYLVAPSPFDKSSHQALDPVVKALRGFRLTASKMPRWRRSRELYVPDGQPTSTKTIAVSSWKTENDSFTAAVNCLPDPDARGRYSRLNRLINTLISQPDGASYLVLPELALPPQWFMRIAEKLKGRGISLIAGVEYLHASENRVRNQVWAAFTHDALGFPSLMIYQQDKQRPALHEEQELFRLAGLQMSPSVRWEKPPVIRHGDFRIGIMICSELTNIRYRSDLRGKVDALFVPEWNSDTETFNALVESAALDIHAYIIQCNDRKFGDSRIRAPYKDRWKRDVLRVKGGIHDYCITGEINLGGLRQFQSSHRSPSTGFKPVPDGFNEDMAAGRKVLPKGNS